MNLAGTTFGCNSESQRYLPSELLARNILISFFMPSSVCFCWLTSRDWTVEISFSHYFEEIFWKVSSRFPVRISAFSLLSRFPFFSLEVSKEYLEWEWNCEDILNVWFSFEPVNVFCYLLLILHGNKVVPISFLHCHVCSWNFIAFSFSHKKKNVLSVLPQINN